MMLGRQASFPQAPLRNVRAAAQPVQRNAGGSQAAEVRGRRPYEAGPMAAGLFSHAAGPSLGTCLAARRPVCTKEENRA